MRINSNHLRLGALVAAAMLIVFAVWTIVRESDDAPRKPDVGYVSTPMDVVDQMLVLARLGKGQMLYDLGSGDGRIPIAAHQQYGAKAIGFELDADLVALSRAAIREAGIGDAVRIDQADIFSLDLSPADVVTLYLNDEVNERLIPQLLKMSPGSRIISHNFGLTGYAPEVTVEVLPRQNGAPPHTIYLWNVPLKARSALNSDLVTRPRPEVGFVPTPMAVVAEMLRLADLKQGQVLYDLGSGDGRILVAAAKDYGARAIGYEIDPDLIAQTNEAIAKAGLEKLVEVRARDLFAADLRDADVVTLYLSEEMNRKLIPQLMELKPGSRIISHNFNIPGLKTQTIIHIASGDVTTSDSTLFVWQVPLQFETP